MSTPRCPACHGPLPESPHSPPYTDVSLKEWAKEVGEKKPDLVVFGGAPADQLPFMANFPGYCRVDVSKWPNQEITQVWVRKESVPGAPAVLRVGLPRLKEELRAASE